MQTSPYLLFTGDCAAAFKFYQDHLGGKIISMMKHAGTPAEGHVPAEWGEKIMHGRIQLGDTVVMASDAPPGHQEQPKGFRLSLSFDKPAEADRAFKALADGGSVQMPIEKTFFAERFGHGDGPLRRAVDDQLRETRLGVGDRFMTKTLILLGTKKGAFILESDAARRSWTLRGPFCEAWPMNHVVADPASGTIYAGGGNEWFGPAVWKIDRSRRDLDAFERGSCLPAGEEPMKTVWSVAPGDGPRFTPASSRPGCSAARMAANRWRHVAGLRDHPSRPQWQPGGGGLILHSLVAASRTIRTADLGRHLRGRRVPHRRWRRELGAAQPRHARRLPARGAALSRIRPMRALPGHGAGHARPLYQQNHCGMYRSDDGGRHWESIEAACPRAFGFPAAVASARPCDALSPAAQWRHRRPLCAGRPRPRCGGRAMAARAGRRCARACRSENAFFGVLRQAMATDPLDAGRRLFRHQHRLALCQRRRRRELELHRAASAGDLVGGNPARLGRHGRAGHRRAAARAGAALPGCAAPRRACRRDGRRRPRRARCALAWHARPASDLFDAALRLHINMFVDGERWVGDAASPRRLDSPPPSAADN